MLNDTRPKVLSIQYLHFWNLWRNLTSLKINTKMIKCFGHFSLFLWGFPKRRFEFQFDIRFQFSMEFSYMITELLIPLGMISHLTFILTTCCGREMMEKFLEISTRQRTFQAILGSTNALAIDVATIFRPFFNRTDSPLSLPILIFVEWMDKIGEGVKHTRKIFKYHRILLEYWVQSKHETEYLWTFILQFVLGKFQKESADSIIENK